MRLQVPIGNNIDVFDLSELIHVSGRTFHEFGVEVLRHYLNMLHFLKSLFPFFIVYQEETTPSISCRPPGKLGSLLFGTSSTSDPAIDTSSIYSSQQTPSMRHATYADLADIFQRLHEYHLFEILDQHHF